MDVMVTFDWSDGVAASPPLITKALMLGAVLSRIIVSVDSGDTVDSLPALSRTFSQTCLEPSAVETSQLARADA